MWEKEWEERKIPKEQWPIVEDSDKWEALMIHRLTAYENRPGYKKFYIEAVDEADNKLGGVKISFNTEADPNGNIYDHSNIWGRTGTRKGREGYAEWDNLGKPTHYEMSVEDELLIWNLRTDLGNEYPISPGSSTPSSWIPINRPGIYSYRIKIRRRIENNL